MVCASKSKTVKHLSVLLTIFLREKQPALKSAVVYLLMLGSSNVSLIGIFAGAGNITDFTERSSSAELVRSIRRPRASALATDRCLLLLVNLALQVQLVCLAGQRRSLVCTRQKWGGNGLHDRKFQKQSGPEIVSVSSPNKTLNHAAT